MPNWCENTLMITGDPIRLQQFAIDNDFASPNDFKYEEEE